MPAELPSVEEALKDLVKVKAPIDYWKVRRKPDAVIIKCKRLKLEVVVAKSYTPTTTTTSLVLPKELPSVEEALKILVAAMNALETPDLSKTEVLRLRNIIQAAGVYQVKVAK